MAVHAPMQGIGDEGEVDSRSTDVGATVGVFKIPSYMPYYRATTITGGGRSPHHEVCYLINYFDTFAMPFVIHHACVSKQHK